MNSTNAPTRTAALQTHIPSNSAWLLSQPEDIRYYTGFDCLVSSEREAFLVLTTNEAFLLHASFSPTTTVFSHITTRQGAFISQLTQHLLEIQAKYPFSNLLCDYKHLLHSEYEAIQKNASFTIDSLKREEIEHQRSQKDSEEQTYLSQAKKLTTELLEWIPTQFVEGITELQLTQALYGKMIELGADITPAFPFIVAFGPHSAKPHHQPTNTPLTLNTPILIDMGTRVHHYCSDMTRTFWFGPNKSEEFIKVEKIVHQAYAAAEKTAFTLPITAREVDEAARNVIAQAGYAEQFIHTTGHGLGLEIHESPSLGWRNTQSLLPGMAITIEPGIYLPEKFGYRFENTLIL